MYVLKSAVVDNAAASGILHIITAVANARIVVVGVDILSGGSTNAQFQDTTASPVLLTGNYPLTAGIRVNLGMTPPNTGGAGQQGWFATSVGKGLDLNITGAVQVAGVVSYYLDYVA